MQAMQQPPLTLDARPLTHDARRSTHLTLGKEEYIFGNSFHEGMVTIR